MDVTSDRLQRLTPREMEILGLMAEGWSNLYIQQKLFMPYKTLRWNIDKLYQKLEVTGTRTKARHPRVTSALMHYRRSQDIQTMFPRIEDLQQWDLSE